MYSYKNNINQDIYVIKDPTSQLILIIGMVVVGMFTLFSIGGTIAEGLALGIASEGFASFIPILIGGVFLSVILLGIFWLLSLRYSAISGGAEINLLNRTMTFPGGGISANDIGDYIDVNPDFWFQYFKRTTIDLDAISEIKRGTKKCASIYGGAARCYYIEFAGTFGAANLKFDNEGKRDELFNAIRQVNKMGAPLFNVAGTGNATNPASSSRGTVVGKSPVTQSAGNKPTSARSLFGKKP